MYPIEQYHQAGIAFPIPALTPEEVVRYRAAFDALEQAQGRAHSQIGLAGRHRDVPFIWELARHPAILDAVEQLVGPDIVLISTHFFCKYPADDSEAGGEKFVAWHQDVTYWGLEPPRAITAWLAIDDADVVNGCMRVVPGTHKLGLLEHGKSDRPGNLLSINQAISEGALEGREPVDVELEAGEMSLHDGMLVHGSNPNHSNRRRCGLTLRYMTPDVRILPSRDQGPTWLPSLVRGQDRYGHIDYLPAPDFAARA